MRDNYTYLLIDLGTLLVPLFYSFHPKISFHKHWYAFWPANLIITLIFVAWDSAFTKNGVWGFNERYILGYRIMGLPIEEILFFICVPYSSIFTYYCFSKFFPSLLQKAQKTISITLICVLLFLGISYFTHLYTSVTFLSLTLLLSIFTFIQKQKWLPTFYLMYLVILVPFFIVNGILTGTGIEEQVVWYNNNENMNVRILTIPVEDVFYGMLLLLLNAALFEKFKKTDA